MTGGRVTNPPQDAILPYKEQPPRLHMPSAFMSHTSRY
jgi:hypothetical protein